MLADALSYLSEIATNAPVAAGLVFVLLRAACIVGGPFVVGGAIDLIGIATFGAFPAFLLAETGIMLGASLAFWIARRFRERILRWKTLASQIAFWEARLREREQFATWTMIRLFTNPLFDPISYAAGLTHCSFRMFFASTLLGNIPSVALFFAFSDMMLRGLPLVGAVGLIGLGITGWVLYRRIKHRPPTQ